MGFLRRELLALSLAGGAAAALGGPARALERGAVGIALPSRSAGLWAVEGAEMQAELAGLGYASLLQFAADDAATQVDQVENMVTAAVAGVVITPVPGARLANALANAAAGGIKVFCHDRLIRDTPHVDGLSAFDELQVGALQARSLLAGLAARFGAAGPWRIELFAGSPGDAVADQNFAGALAVLAPLIAAGQLRVPSGQVDASACATPRWDAALAQVRMERLLAAAGAGPPLQGVLSPEDGMSLAILSALGARGYGPDPRPLPIVTGQGASLASVRSILAGGQYSTVFCDRRALARHTVDRLVAAMAGLAPDGEQSLGVDNGRVWVPAYLLTPHLIDATNWKAELIETGYFTEGQLR